MLSRLQVVQAMLEKQLAEHVQRINTKMVHVHIN
jgi:hypothetical protein